MTEAVQTGYPQLAMHIDGEWIVPGTTRDTIEVMNPATGSVLGALPLADADDLDRALAAAERGFAIWRHASADQRSAVLRGAASHLRERRETIAANATAEQGKTLAEALVEVEMAARLFEFYAEETFRLYGRTLVRPAGQRSFVGSEPVGPVAAFAPWNFPICNPARKFGAPVAAGCSVILKPAEEAPASAIAVMQALIDAGLPEGVAQLVFGVPDAVSRHLLASPVIRKISFTGSVPVGRQLLGLSSLTLKRSTMELGGHAPVIIFDDAEIERAADILAASKFRNAGQVCIAPTRFYVQDAVHDRFVDAFVQRVTAIRMGNGAHEGVTMGPMANARRPQAISALVEDAVAQGARLRAGGSPGEGPGHFWQPTLLTDVPIEARIMNEEPFGPVAITARFSTFEEVVSFANRLPYGLAAYAFTENGRRANLIADAIEAGMVGINGTAVGGADSPFGGVKDSGHGSEDGPEGVMACRVIKAVHHM